MKKNVETAKNAEQKYNDFVSNLIIKTIESGTAPWVKPWSTEAMLSMAPRNPETGKFYKGSNQLNLMMVSEINQYNDPRWMTYNQAKAVGGIVNHGEHGVPLRTFIFEKDVPVIDENGKPVLDENGKEVTTKELLDKPIIKSFTVFNVKQMTFPLEHKYSKPFDKTVDPKQVWENLERAEALIKNTNAQIKHYGATSFYRPSTDEITVPSKNFFKDQEGYYSTVLHELSHWTGHPGRLNRPLIGQFGSKSYAKEELVAEISSFMLCMNLGIGHNLENHASYVNNWLQVLKEDKNEIIEATKKAGEAQQFISCFSKHRILDEDRIYLVGAENDKQIAAIVDLGAFYDNSKNGFYITNKTHDISKFIEYLPADIKKTMQNDKAKTSDISVQKEEDIDKSKKEKVENCVTALNKAIKYLNDHNDISVMNDNEKSLYLGELTDLIVQAQTLKQVVELENELQLHNIKNEVLKSLNENKTPNPASADVYIEVPFYEKKDAKELGAKWDRKIKHWYVPKDVDLNPFDARWKRADLPQIKYQSKEQQAQSLSLLSNRNSKSESQILESNHKTKTR